MTLRLVPVIGTRRPIATEGGRDSREEYAEPSCWHPHLHRIRARFGGTRRVDERRGDSQAGSDREASLAAWDRVASVLQHPGA